MKERAHKIIKEMPKVKLHLHLEAAFIPDGEKGNYQHEVETFWRTYNT
jgi:hypothetical protein